MSSTSKTGRKRKYITKTSIPSPVFHLAQHHRHTSKVTKSAPTPWFQGSELTNETLNVANQPPQPVPPHFEGHAGTSFTGTSRSRYAEKKQSELKSWLPLRDMLLKATVERQAPLLENVCSRCNREDTEVLRCVDCHSSCMCRPCMIETHPIQHMHLFEKFEHGIFVPQEIQVLKTFKCAGYCGSKVHTELIISLIDEKGRTHDGCRVECCSQDNVCVSLLRQGFWPMSPVSPTVAVSTHLLSQMTCFTLENQTSTKGFVDAVNLLNRSLNNSKLGNIQRGEAVAEYRLYWHNYHSMTAPVLSLEEGNLSCPACPKEQGTVQIAFDANFGLVHKAHSGTSLESSTIGPSMFFDQEDVDNFVTNYGHSEICPVKECSQFQASTAVRSKNKAANLNVTGVFGSVCKHEVPFKFMDIRHGERLSYSVYVLRELVKKYQDKDVGLHVLYDIACVLQSHLVKAGSQNLLDKIVLAIPVFHSYGHKGDCQVTMNPRRLEQFGLVDGEQLERLWSYLRPFAKITKEQTPRHRKDLLTMALHHYSRQKIDRIEDYLVRKMGKAEETQTVSTDKMKELLEQHQGAGVKLDSVIRSWEDEEKQLLREKRLINAKTKKTWREGYMKNLVKLYSIQYQLQSALLSVESAHDAEQMTLARQKRRLDEELRKIEQQRKMTRWLPSSDDYKQQQQHLEQEQQQKYLFKCRNLAVEKEFLFSLGKKHSSGGQSVANRISMQVKKVVKSLRSTVILYNEACFTSNSTFPNQLIYNDVKSANCPVFEKLENELNEDHQRDQRIPAAQQVSNQFRRQVLDTEALRCRASEEKVLLEHEMCRTLDHFIIIHQSILSDHMAPVPAPSAYSRGLRAISTTQLFALEQRLITMHGKFVQHTDCLPDLPLDTFITYRMDHGVITATNLEDNMDWVVMPSEDSADALESSSDEESVYC